MAKLEYSEEIEVQGIRIPFVPEIITPRIERQMRLGRYESGECKAAKKWVRAGDRVLELGAGVGLVGSAIASIEGVERVVSIEANIRLLDMIAETHKINNIDTVEMRNGIVAKEAAPNTPFYVRPHFWASSMAPDPHYSEEISLPAYALGDLIEEIKPTVIVADIEGGELEAFDDVTLDGVRVVILELHTPVYGIEGQRKILKHFDKLGFRAEAEYLSSSVWILNRTPHDPAPRIYTRGATPPEHTASEPTFLIPTCMKNEGPYLLEWLAYHRSIGIQGYIVFTNDCTDGTDLMLDRLDEMGLVTHLPNPAVAAGSTYFQPIAMKFAMQMAKTQHADYIIQTDVDEFINIKVGDGLITDLLDAAGPFHVLSMSELNFTSSGHWEFEDGWLTENFREHETPQPGHWQARRGVKSIIHGIDNFQHWPVHRPNVHPNTHDQLLWLDGSGKPMPEDFILNNENGIDRRGRYDLVQIDHHPLRSAQFFFMKQARGEVAHAKLKLDHHYYRKRAIGGQYHGVIDRHLPRARAEWEKLIADSILADLHEKAVAIHKEKIAMVEHSPHMADLRNWMIEHYFKDRS
ncbi:MAG: glycosyltransferase family 2 protein [Pseudomonadota bacterium]